MIKSNLYILLVLISFLSFSQNENCTSIYLIRHAEKVRDGSKNSNPHLNAKGILRADKWKDILRNIKFDKILSTNLFRTLETALPISKTNNLEILKYKPSNKFYKKFLEQNNGKTILIVGHSNTIPTFTNNILNKKNIVADK